MIVQYKACLITTLQHGKFHLSHTHIYNVMHYSTLVFVLLLLSPSSAGAPPAESIVMSMLQRRTSDSKVAVRKSALLALEALTRLHRDGVKEEVRSMDPVMKWRLGIHVHVHVYIHPVCQQNPGRRWWPLVFKFSSQCKFFSGHHLPKHSSYVHKYNTTLRLT